LGGNQIARKKSGQSVGGELETMSGDAEVEIKDVRGEER